MVIRVSRVNVLMTDIRQHKLQTAKRNWSRIMFTTVAVYMIQYLNS